MKFTTHLVALDFEADTATFHLPPGTRMGAGTYTIESTAASNEPATEQKHPPPPMRNNYFDKELEEREFATEMATWERMHGLGYRAQCAAAKLMSATFPKISEHEPTDEQIDAIADGMPGGLEGFLKGWGWRQFARKVLELRAPPTWEPQFDVMSPKQEALVQQFCAEIAGPKGQPGRPPDPVRLLEMAQSLYEAEREECGPAATAPAVQPKGPKA